jgi:uncharacterized repeat protein (TIGR04052 family)
VFRVLPIALLAACVAPSPFADDQEGTDSDVRADDSESGPTYPDGVDFELRVGGEVVGCGDDLRGLGTTAQTMNLVDARMYVSDLVLSGPTSGSFTFTPDQDDPFQHDAYALVDFEDATGLCATSGTAAVHTHVGGYVPEGDWDTLTFTVGLPHDDAHLPIGSATSPLDVVGMYRTAQLGRWFLRLDLRSVDGGAGADFGVDVGNDGCTSASAQTPPESPCTRPSLARVSVPFAPFAEGVRPVVALDLLELLAVVDLTQNEAGPPGCQSSPDDTYECAPIWPTLGMAFGTAECVDDCAGQTAFRAVCRSLASGAEVPCP